MVPLVGMDVPHTMGQKAVVSGRRSEFWSLCWEAIGREEVGLSQVSASCVGQDCGTRTDWDDVRFEF